MKKKPIGVFDSGYGGLTVLKEIVQLLPQYDFIYLGDNARAPYGTKDFDLVYQYTLEAVKWFFSEGCELVILACNTASAKALRTIQQNDLPLIDEHKRVLGVIRPTAEVIGEYTKRKHVGILATKGTVNSESYVLEIEKTFPTLKVSQEACLPWVTLVENNLQDSAQADEPVKEHLNNLLEKDVSIDCILLACTHYPLLMHKIKQFLPSDITVLSQGKIVAESLHKYLVAHPKMEESISKNGSIVFYTTGNVQNFDAHAGHFYGKKINAMEIIL